ncbi:MAG: DUF3299 domain-containing protein [Planctomycetia bacterium]|nr:DUF3299 domain-containing protein [Planctomycetia bacterium]
MIALAGCADSNASTNSASSTETTAASGGGNVGSPAVTPVSAPAAAQVNGAAQPARPVRPPRKVGDLYEISFDNIKLAMNKEEPFRRELITPEIEALDGKKVRIRGWINPNSPGAYRPQISNFVFVRDNMECCFGPGAAVYDCIMVELRPGVSTSFTTLPIAVEGTFRIDVWKDEFTDTVMAIYHLDGEAVIQ